MLTQRRCKNPECNEFIPYYDRRHYCTKRCKQQHYRARSEPHYRVAMNPYKHRCRNCGKKFESLTPLSKYCTRACKQSFYRQHKKLSSEKPTQTSFPDTSYTVSNALT